VVVDVVPRIEASEAHQGLSEFSIIGEKEFFNTIGAKRSLSPSFALLKCVDRF
jgi:hypothetical protein